LPIQATQENALTENDSQAGVNPVIATPEKLKPSPILNRKKMNLENIDANEIENFLQKYPQALPLIKEEFLSEEIKAKINSKPLVPFSIFTNSHKKRTRENNNEEETTIQKESVLTDNDCKKKLDASTSSASLISNLKNFERKKTEKFSFSKPTEPFSTTKDPGVVESLNATIELSDSDDDAKFGKVNQNKRFSVLKTTKSIEGLDIMDRNENDGDQEMNGL
jgi:hypothetical protein